MQCHMAALNALGNQRPQCSQILRQTCRDHNLRQPPGVGILQQLEGQSRRGMIFRQASHGANSQRHF